MNLDGRRVKRFESGMVVNPVTIAPDAAPGQREIRLVTLKGVSNPLVFHVGQVPETARKPMLSATLQVLGKEEGALRKRPPEEEEAQVTVPCTANGQIASGDDVGLGTSLAIDSDGNPAGAYHDATNRALRYAERRGSGWSSTLVDRRDFGDEGRYAKLLFVGGQPVEPAAEQRSQRG